MHAYSIEIPAPPVISGNPLTAVSPGSTVTVMCKSNGTSPLTRLVWYRDGRQVGIRYAVVGSFVENVYEFKADGRSQINLECRLEFPPTQLKLATSVVIIPQGTQTIRFSLCSTLALFTLYHNKNA